MPLRIAIIGAGPAGCTLARLLQQSKEDVSATIFESEGDINFRSQGGTLDLHEKTGQAALKAANLFDQFQKHARYDGEAMTMCDKKLLVFIKQGANTKGSTTGRPEIDRPKLRKLLYESLDTDTVVWSHKLQSVDKDGTLHFTNGKTESGFDLVVGADGAWSHVRPLLSDAKPYYSGIAGHAFTLPNAEKTQTELYKLVNRGSLFSWSDGKSIMAQQMGDGSLSIATWSVRSENWRKECGYDVLDGKAVKEACRRDYADWDSRLVAFTQRAEDHVVPRDLFMLPIGHRWEHVKGVTLIGDASHLMTPFAGEGVNLALSDSLALSKAIITATQRPEAQRREALDQNIIDFEREMFERAEKYQSLTYDMMRLMYFVPGAPRSTVEQYLLRAVGDELGYWLTLLATPVVYAWFAVFKTIWWR